MKSKSNLVFCCLLLVSPVLGMLPMPTPPEQQTQPPQVPQQQASQTGVQTMQNSAAHPHVEFDFKGFFDYFIRLYGPTALLVFQQKLNERKGLEGLTSVNVPGDPIPCGLAQAYTGATLTYDHVQRIHGSTAKYTCEMGYKGPEAIIMCISGAWSTPKVAVSCTMVTCGPTPVMQHGHVTVTDHKYGATATYTCDPGYQADDIAAPIKCQGDGSWSIPSFRCTNMMATHHRMSQMAHMGSMMGGAGAMSSMMQAMGGGAAASMFGGAAGGATGGGGLNSAMMGAIAQAMGNAQAAGAGGGMGAMMGNLAAMMGGAGGAPGAAGGMSAMMPSALAQMMRTGQAAGPPSAQGALPPHLVSLGKMAPMLLPGMLGGPLANGMGGTPGMPGQAGMPPAKPLEPEQQQEQMMMMMMMNNMHAQHQKREAQRRQLLRRQEQQRQLQLQQQRRQRQLQQQQKHNSINISDLLAKNGGQGGNQMDALRGAMQRLGGSGTESNNMLAALQTLKALANAIAQMNSGSSSSSPSSSSSSPSQSPNKDATAGGASVPQAGAQQQQQQQQQQQTSGQSQPSSVFGSGAGGSTGSGQTSSSSSSSSSSSPSSSSSASGSGNPLQDAIVAAALGKIG